DGIEPVRPRERAGDSGGCRPLRAVPGDRQPRGRAPRASPHDVPLRHLGRGPLGGPPRARRSALIAPVARRDPPGRASPTRPRLRAPSDCDKRPLAMIPRYTPQEFRELWSDRTRYAIWLEVELAACEAEEEAGLVPKGTAAAIRSKNLTLDPARIEAIEATTRHDVIAFLTHVEELAGEPARWLHRGMTSSDVLDTSLAIQLVRGADLLL